MSSNKENSERGHPQHRKSRGSNRCKLDQNKRQEGKNHQVKVRLYMELNNARDQKSDDKQRREKKMEHKTSKCDNSLNNNCSN
jgi:hypothetical protein